MRLLDGGLVGFGKVEVERGFVRSVGGSEGVRVEKGRLEKMLFKGEGRGRTVAG